MFLTAKDNVLVCPFCGSGFLEYTESEHTSNKGTENEYSYLKGIVHCHHCHAKGPEVDNTQCTDLFKECIGAWNRLRLPRLDCNNYNYRK